MPISPKSLRERNPIYQPEKDYLAIGKSSSQSVGAKAAATIRYLVYPGGSGDEIQAIDLGRQLARFVQSGSIQEDETMMSKLVLTLFNPDNELSKKKVIKEGDEIAVQLGYGTGTTTNNNRFRLMKVNPQYPRNSPVSITFEGYDGRWALIHKDHIPRKRKRKARTVPLSSSLFSDSREPPTHFNGSDTDKIDQMASFYGYAIDVDPSPIKNKPRVRRKNVSMGEFLVTLAKENDFTTWVDWDEVLQTWTIHFREKQTAFTGGREFTYQLEKGKRGWENKGTLLEFSPSKDLTRQVTDVKIINFDRRAKKLNIESLSTNDNKAIQDIETNGALLKFRLDGRMVETYSARPFKNKKEARTYARYLVSRWQSDFMIGNGVVVGTENLRPRQIHRLLGIGDESGEYYFTQTTHKWGVGQFYETDFVAYKILDNSLRTLIKRGQVVQTFSTDGTITPTSVGI